ncbi:anks1b [Symbiodinium natans]|uniref:Anks1b protein n=1 Tax=Symbiodinium natans TaxID=878477 RepID=A0A812QKK2_9DINO|nr:anks1b [Symbiodinium natans]
MADYFPEYSAWLSQFELLKECCDIPGTVTFCQEHPGTVNNRKHNLQGNCFLHQIAFWGVSQDIVEQFMHLGSDPTLRNYNNDTPMDMATREGHANTAQAFREVFGEPQACDQQKADFLTAAKTGDFVKCFDLLRAHPWLRNVQSYKGWSVLHQAAYHGVSSRLLTRLLDLGVSEDLKTVEGATFLDILQEHHPNHGFLANSESPSASRLGVGSPVMLKGGGRGVLSSVSDHFVQVQLQSGEVVDCLRWQVCRVPASMQDDADDLIGMHCLSCWSGIPPTWTVGADCQGEPHGLCAECRNAWMWSQYNACNVPLRCTECDSICSTDHLRTLITRGTLRSWEEQKDMFHTSMSYEEFLQALDNRLAEMGDIETRVSLIRELINNHETTPEPIMYCDVEGAPAFRVCRRCASVIEYESQCKHMTCRCGYSFCWLCTREEDEHQDGDWCYTRPCEIAPRESEEVIRHILHNPR